MKNAMIITAVSGFLNKFELENVCILQGLGYQVHYASNVKDPHYFFEFKKLEELQITMHHIDIARSPYMFRANKRAYKQLLDLIERYQIRLIHCHTPVGGVLGRLAGRRFQNQVKVFYTAHGFHFYKGAPLLNNSVFRMIESGLARYTDVLITINQEDYQAGKTLQLRPGGAVFQIPGAGLDLCAFQRLPDDNKGLEKEKLGMKADAFHIITVGELNENKNQEVMLCALQKLKKENPKLAEKICYSIYGEGFFRKRLEKLIQVWHLSDMVSLRGYTQDVRTALVGADLFAFPSKREGLGMVAVEALAMGVPVISGDNRGTREYMQHRKNGSVCKENSAAEYVKEIVYYANVSSDGMKQMQVYCRESVQKFAKENTNDIMRVVYEKA
ncbi:MAG: glycosyltransferase [Lachnospiraceae bacterium]|nr:glycosyltransferase [Lachnospiraceae bacterium]